MIRNKSIWLKIKLFFFSFSAAKRYRSDDTSNEDRHSLSDSSDKPRTPDSRSLSPASTGSSSPPLDYNQHRTEPFTRTPSVEYNQHRVEPFTRTQPEDIFMQQKSMDMLTRIFPQTKTNVLHLILQGCNGDVVQAIEQVLNHAHEQELRQAQSQSYSPSVLQQTYFGSSLDNSLKSAFSPTSISSLPSVHHYNSLRYALGSAGLGSRTPFSVSPYSSMLSGTSVSPVYSNISRFSPNVAKPYHYPTCP